MIIDVKKLFFGYKENQDILKDVSFHVEEGQYVTLIGHNGSGKSTLSKILAGLYLDYRAEKCEVLGVALEKQNLPEIRKRIGLVFQNPDNQFVASTVKDDIAFGLENRQMPREEMLTTINKWVKEVGMEDYLNKAPENLSGGQKQRVAIAGVLALEPDLLILDEATSMLDPVGKNDVLNLVKEMRKKKPSLTLISITHDVEEALHSDYVLVMNEGRIILEGTPKEVFKHHDLLTSVHLKLPFIYEMKEALKTEGFKVPDNIDNEEELVNYLCR